MRTEKPSQPVNQPPGHREKALPSQKKTIKSKIFGRFSSIKPEQKTELIFKRSPHYNYSPKARRNVFVTTPHTLLRNNDVLQELLSPLKQEHTNVSGTVPHEIMEPTQNALKQGITGLWHVKYPKRVTRMERVKQFFRIVFMKLTNNADKARYFQNPKSMAEREVVAAQLDQLASTRAPSFATHEWGTTSQQSGILLNNGETCVAGRHIEHDHTASKVLNQDTVYDGEHNPASAFIFRTILFGDYDGAKGDNYLVKSNEAGAHCFIPIDYGFTFYKDHRKLLAMPFEQFVTHSLKLPTWQRLHYNVIKRNESIMGVIHSMSQEDKNRAAYMALSKISALNAKGMHTICANISDPAERKRIENHLFQTVTAAKELMKKAEQHPDIQPLLV